MPTRPNIDVFERLKASTPKEWSAWSTVHSPGRGNQQASRKPPHRLISFRIIDHLFLFPAPPARDLQCLASPTPEKHLSLSCSASISLHASIK